MAQSRRKPGRRKPEETRARLLDAAEAEFNTRGYHGTDTNRIAHAAGYAPQTFYRHYANKTAVFLAVYDRWWRAEGAVVGDIVRTRGRSPAALATIAEIVIAFHTHWRIFRRSLRLLAVEDGKVRKARAAARLAQIRAIKALPGGMMRSDVDLIAALLKLERLCDAVADDELTDLGITEPVARAMVVAAVHDTHGG